MYTTERETLVADAVLDLATRSDGFDILDLLHDLTDHIVTLLTVRAAGVTILSEDGHVDYLTASDESCRLLEEDQIDLDEGPCVDCTRSGTVLFPVALGPFGAGARRWPRFTPRALRAGVLTVSAVPLRTPEHTLGALNLMSATAPASSRDLRLTQVLADATVASMRHRQTMLTKNELIGQLEIALDSRIVIEQAKGVLASRQNISVEEAFVRLRSHARSRRQKLSDLADQVARGEIPGPLDPAT
ncbi:ANTAR domain-containing protein [Streptomyces sp. NPDC059785]|uniref:ANTAR domain-containing protein n=1 Tax=unclassified Streptomyces TaxID=2593676 RepID=UPI003657829C